MKRPKYVRLGTGEALPDGWKPQYVVGAKLDELGSVAAGSRFMECTICGATMLIAPDGQRSVREGAVLLCGPCAVKRVESQIGKA